MKGIKILLFALICLVAQGCTRNDGNIGPIWGMWRVTSIEVDGKPLDNYEGNLYFSFQASVFYQKFVYEEIHSYTEAYALWMYEGKDLKIIFTEDRYKPIAITGMQHKTENLVKVHKLEGKDLHLSYKDPQGTEYFYYLKKW